MVDIQPKEHKKCPGQFYLGLCFQMRVTPEIFIKDSSPSAACMADEFEFLKLQALLPLVQQHMDATQQCITSWGITGYTTSLSLLEFAVLSLNLKQAILLCNAAQQADILTWM